MALAQRLTNTGVLQIPGTFDEYTPSNTAGQDSIYDALAAYPSTTSGTGLTYSGTPGIFTWTCPVDVTSISVVAVGGGGGSGGNGGGGGGGGALAYINNYSVTPGVIYNVVCGIPGNAVSGNASGTNGGQSYFNNASTVAANGGTAGLPSGTGSTGGAGGTVAAGTGFAGGAGGNGYATNRGGGGGGAGGYTAVGGAGGIASATTPTAGSSSTGGGGGGGAGQGFGGLTPGVGTPLAGCGGGVGLFGSGSNGIGGGIAGTSNGQGGGGSGGTAAVYSGTAPSAIAYGGSYGGGAGSIDGGLGIGLVTTGGPGAVRIMWGLSRSFPSNASAAPPNAWTDSRLTSDGNLYTKSSFDEISLSTYYSVSFNGTSQYLNTTPTSSAFTFGTGDFTVEMWVNPNIINTVGLTLIQMGIGGFTCQIGNGRWELGRYGYGITSGVNYNFSAGTWYHIAVSRLSGNTYFFVNGGLMGGPIVDATNFSGVTVIIGDFGAGRPGNIGGLLSNLRIVKGTALYTSSFKIPSIPLTAVDGTSLLTCQSATIIDNGIANGGAPFTITNVGSATTILDAPATSGVTLRRQTATSYQVYDSFDELSLAYTITPDKTIVNEGDTVTYTINAPMLGGGTGTGTLYYTNAGSTVAADFTGGLVYGVTPLTWAGTATATLWSFTGITQLSTSGFGTGAVFSIRKNNPTTTMGTYGVLTVIPTSAGSGYTIGDTIVIDGASLGLTTTTNNLTITVGSDWFAQLVNPATVTGTGLSGAAAGTATWTVPDGVYRVSFVCVGGGGGGAQAASAQGGGGGALAYAVDQAVIPGQIYTITAGAGGVGTSGGTAGGDSSWAGYVVAGGGFGGGTGAAGGYPSLQTTGTFGFSGGAGGAPASSTALGLGGGGGAGGYSSNGGAGGYPNSSNFVITGGTSIGGGAGGGSSGGGAGTLDSVGNLVNTSTGNGGGGGGTLLLGSSNIGIGGVNLAGSTGAILGQGGFGGSGGSTGGTATATVGGAGAIYGGGGGGGSTTGGAGGAGAARFIWNYPHGFLPDQTALTAVTNTILLTAQAATAIDQTGINTINNPLGPTVNTTTIPFAGAYSYQFNGTTQYLSIPDSNDFKFGSDDFTIECWIYSTSSAFTSRGVFYKRTVYAGVCFGVSSQVSGKLMLLVANDAGNNWTVLDNSVSYTINTWYHIAVTKTNGNVYLYVNGTLRSTNPHTTTIYDDGAPFTIGADPAGAGYWTGYISNIRVIKGTAIYNPTTYPSGFSVPTSALSVITNTKLLTLQSSSIFDATNINNITINPFLTVSTTIIPFASTYSWQFNGTTQYVTVAHSSNFVFGSGVDFTIEGYLYTSATTINKGLYYKRTNVNSICGVNFGTSTTTVSRFTLKVANATGSAWTINDETAGTFVINTWYHFAITKTNGVIYLYLNGLMVRQYAHTTAIYDDGSVLNIGQDPGGARWVGYLSNIRVIKGTALYYPSTIVNRNYPDYPYVVQNSGTISIVDSTYTTPGTYSWTCPQGVTSINAICVGGGGSGGAYDSGGGGGGGLGYKNNITVIPGTAYTIVVGAGGVENITGSVNSGGDSYFISTSTVKGGGGGGGLSSATASTGGGAGGTYVGDGGGNGGAGGAHVNANMCGAGGGAGGYAGTGGAGAAGAYDVEAAGGNPAVGSGGAGGGSNGIDHPYGFGYAAGGGGVGILGKGVDGLGGAADPGFITTGQGGIGGSGGTNGGIPTGSIAPYGGLTGTGRGGAGGIYGGGGGGGPAGGGAGGNGAVRIYTTSPRTLALTVGQDILQEGVQDIKLQLRSGSTSGTILATAPTVVVADTSRPLALPGGGQCWCAYPDYVSGPNLVYTGTPGSFTFTAPKGYTTVSVVCIGGGGSGGGNGGGGGGGGALAYIASTAVTAGTTYTVVCGAGGTTGGAGGASSFNTSTVIANGGQPGLAPASNPTLGGAGGTVGAGTGFAGGAGGTGSVSLAGGGGGGAGGYTAAGGVGGTFTGTYPTTLVAGSGAASATGGAGGSAGGSATAGGYFGPGGGGGGTSPFGSVAVASIAGTSLAGTQNNAGRGGGGSGGVATTAAFGVQLGERGYTANVNVAGQRPNGGRYGGGGGGGDGGNPGGDYGDGGAGCVRIIWGTGRAYPSTLTADRVSGYPAAVGNPTGQQ